MQEKTPVGREGLGSRERCVATFFPDTDQDRSPSYPLHPSLKVSSHKAGCSVSEGLLRSQRPQRRGAQPPE